MQNENSIHVDDVTCDTRQVIFVCTYSAYSYNFQNRAGLQKPERKWKGNHVSELLNQYTRISSSTTAFVYGNNRCDARHKSLQGLTIKYLYEAIDGTYYIKRYAIMNALYARTKLKLFRQNFCSKLHFNQHH